jgi:phosphatidate cytidylyltransferase
MNEFTKRLLTSIVILIITIFFLFSESFVFAFFLLLIFIFTSREWINLSIKQNKLILIFGIVILILSFVAAFYLQKKNLNYFILLILISVFSDIGGYIFGKIFGGPKLTKISPNKTYSGMFGSYFAAFIIGILYIDYININSFFKNQLSFLQICFLIFLLSSINQLGDLLISYFKRLRGFNDTGNILPGHGGFLDRIDGLIFSILAGWVLINLFIL